MAKTFTVLSVKQMRFMLLKEDTGAGNAESGFLYCLIPGYPTQNYPCNIFGLSYGVGQHKYR